MKSVKKIFLASIVPLLALDALALHTDDAHIKSLKYYNPVVGTVTGLAILVEFPDVRSTYTPHEIDLYLNGLNSSVANNEGSVRDYFLSVSNKLLDLRNMVMPEVCVMPNNYSYYADTTTNRKPELVREALNCAIRQDQQRTDVDLSRLSVDSAKVARSINIIVSGDGAGIGTYWSTMSALTLVNTTTSKVVAGKYQISHTFPSHGGLQMSSVAHENGHMLLGWPDLYDTNGGSAGIATNGLMGSSADPKNPIPPNPYLRMLAGWLKPKHIHLSDTSQQITIKSDSDDVYQVSNTHNPHEFFLIQAVNQTGRYEGMPDRGLLVWHIDEYGDANKNQQMTRTSHYRVAVEQADGRFDLESNVNGGDSFDYYDNVSGIAFGPDTAPNSNWWSGLASGLAISKVSAAGSTMTFTVTKDFGMSLEAELGIIQNGKVATAISGFSGTGYVDPNASTAASIEFGIRADSTGDHFMRFRYANTGSTSISARIFVDGKFAKNITFPATSSSWKEASVLVPVLSGFRKITLVPAVSSSALPNVDRLALEYYPIIGLMKNGDSAKGNHCIDLSGGSIATGSRLTSNVCSTASASQRWHFKQMGDGSYRLESLISNKCISVPSTASDPLVQNLCGTALTQRWNHGWRGFSPVTSASTGGCITDRSTSLVQSTCTGAADQNWDYGLSP